MKILRVWASPEQFSSGCWFIRERIPGNELEKRGHKIKRLVLGWDTDNSILDWPDVVFFSRFYKQNPRRLVEVLKKKNKGIVYDIDDDLWSIPKANPVKMISDAMIDSVDTMAEMSDVITTTTYMDKTLKSHGIEQSFVCPNALNFDRYYPSEKKNRKLRVGWQGGATHWRDLRIALDPIAKLQKEYDFEFFVQGIAPKPLAVENYHYRKHKELGYVYEKGGVIAEGLKTMEKLAEIDFTHLPFYPPELHADLLRQMNLDIAIAPLENNKFNKSKSCIKFYEGVATGSAFLASDVKPYNEEMEYVAKNNFWDWKEKLEKLLSDDDFRQELWEKQWKYVQERADISRVGDRWEEAFKKAYGKTLIRT